MRPQEQLQILVAAAQRMFTKPCGCVEELDGKCYACKGDGEAPVSRIRRELLGDEVVRRFVAGREGITAIEKCPRCNGDGLCPACKGSKKDVPGEYDDVIVSAVLSAVLPMLSLLRAADDWASFHELLDVSDAWARRGQELTLPGPEELQEQLAAIFGVPDPPPPSDTPPRPGVGEYTEEELRGLGVLDED